MLTGYVILRMTRLLESSSTIDRWTREQLAFRCCADVSLLSQTIIKPLAIVWHKIFGDNDRLKVSQESKFAYQGEKLCRWRSKQ